MIANLCLVANYCAGRSASFGQDTIEIKGRADQTQMGQGLREISQRFTAMTDLLRIESHVVSIAEHLLEHQARFLDPARSSQRCDQPEAAHAKGAFPSGDAVHGIVV